VGTGVVSGVAGGVAGVCGEWMALAGEGGE